MPIEVKDLNALRRRVRDLWETPGDRPAALIHLSDEEGDREAVGSAFRTISSEMGLRHLRFDLSGGLTDEHRSQIARRGDRLVVLTGIDGVAPEARTTLEDDIRKGARTLPICVVFGPTQEIERIGAAWRMLREGAARRARDEALIAADDAARPRT